MNLPVPTATGFKLAPGPPDTTGLLGDLFAQFFSLLASQSPAPSKTIGTDYAAQLSDSTIFANGPNSQAITLPSTFPKGKRITVKNIGAGSPINVEGTGTELSGNWQLFSVPTGIAAGGSVTLEWDGANWWAIVYQQ